MWSLNSESCSFLRNLFLQSLSILQLQPKGVIAAVEMSHPATSELRAEPAEEPDICEVKDGLFVAMLSMRN